MAKTALSTIHSRLDERYLFNFRVAPEILASRIPVSWLKPRIVNGWGVVSFCILKLERVRLGPMPAPLGVSTTSCAYRCGVIDVSGASPEPSVYIAGRSTDLPLGNILGPALLGKMQKVRTDISRAQDHVDVRASYTDGKSLFSAKARPLKKELDSELFGSPRELIDFIKGGASSYSPSSRAGHYSRVDLEEDSTYEVIDAEIDYSGIDAAWQDAELAFDSAIRATGGRYDLTYLGRLPARLQPAVAVPA